MNMVGKKGKMVMRFGEMLVFGGEFWNLKANFVFFVHKDS